MFYESIQTPDFEVNYHTNVFDKYQKELRLVNKQEELDVFLVRWGFLCQELRGKKVSFDKIKALIGNPAEQDKCHEVDLMNVLLTRTLLTAYLKAKQFGVTDGLVLLQLLNSGRLTLRTEGLCHEEDK